MGQGMMRPSLAEWPGLADAIADVLASNLLVIRTLSVEAGEGGQVDEPPPAGRRRGSRGGARYRLREAVTNA
jgi:hypothetical protein